MADRFYSVNLGQQNPHQVTEGAATSGQQIELRVNDTAYATKSAVILGIEALLNYLKTSRETSPIA